MAEQERKYFVRWIVEEGKRTIGFAQGTWTQGKRIVIDRNCPFLPKPEELTQVEIVKVIAPEDDPRRGTIIVRPILRPHPSPFPRGRARKEMKNLLGSKPRTYREPLIPVDLPGWRGGITYSLRREEGALSGEWFYRGADGQTTLDLETSTTFTPGIVYEHGVFRLCNWQRAIQDLGQPYQLDNTTFPDRLIVRWPGISGELEHQAALQEGVTFGNIRLEKGFVVADTSLLGGLWNTTAVLGEAERVVGTKIQRASLSVEYTPHLTSEVQAAVEAILRANRYTSRTYQQAEIRRLAYEGSPSSIWHKLDTIREDTYGFKPMWLIREELRELRELRRRLEEVRNATYAFQGAEDPRLYTPAVSEPDLSGHIAENNAHILSLDEAIAELQEDVRQVPYNRNHSSFRKRVEEEIDALHGPKYKQTRRAKVLSRQLNHLRDQARQCLERRAIEDALNYLLEAQELLQPRE